MKKIILTEEQLYRLVLNEEIDANDKKVEENTDVQDEPAVEESKEDESEDLLESIETTKGGLEVRNLILEGKTIKGEIKSAYGKWYNNEWDETGEPLHSQNKYNKYVLSLNLKK